MLSRSRGLAATLATVVALVAALVPGHAPTAVAAPATGPTTTAWQEVGASGVEGRFLGGFLSAHQFTNSTFPVAYRQDSLGDTKVRGLAFGMDVRAGRTSTGRYLVPVMTIGCGWEPHRRVLVGINVGSATGAYEPAMLQIDASGTVSVLAAAGGAVTVSEGVATFSGFVPLDGIAYEADSTETCSSPSTVDVQPAGRYRAAVFPAVTTTGPATFAEDFPTSEGTPGNGTATFDLQYEMIEPEDDPMTEDRKAVVILNGGGFAIGGEDGRDQQRAAAEAWAKAGWVAFLVDYPAYPTGLPDDDDEDYAEVMYPVMLDTARSTLEFWQFLDGHADAWGIDMDATALTGWSASGVTVLQMLAATYDEATEGDPPTATYPAFPRYILSMSADWVPVVPGTFTADDVRPGTWVTMLHFAGDTYDDSQTPDWAGHCAAIGTCNEISLPGDDHNLWLQPSGGTTVWTPADTVTECFEVATPASGCTPLDEVLALADRHTPQG